MKRSSDLTGRDGVRWRLVVWLLVLFATLILTAVRRGLGVPLGFGGEGSASSRDMR